jgi:hypothetical protein
MAVLLAVTSVHHIPSVITALAALAGAYEEFIEEASRLYIEALQNDEVDVSALMRRP